MTGDLSTISDPFELLGNLDGVTLNFDYANQREPRSKIGNIIKDMRSLGYGSSVQVHGSANYKIILRRLKDA